MLWSGITHKPHTLVQVNGDTGSNYDMQRLDGFGSSVAAYKETGIIGWSQIAMMGAGDSHPSPGFIMVPNAFATTGYLAMIGSSSGYVERSRFGAGTWRSTAALTSMNFVAPETGNGTGITGTFSLYVVDESYLVSGGEEVLTGTSAFTNRSVPSQVGDISIINYMRSARSATNDGIALDINTDTTATNYNNQALQAYATTAYAAVNQYDNNQIGGCNAATADSNYFSGALTTVNAFNYGDNDPHAICLSGHISVSAADGWASLYNTQRNNVAAVTSVNVSPTVSSTFLAGSGQWVYAVPKVLLERKTLTDATTTSVTFTLSGLTIPDNVKHLRLNVYGRGDEASVYDWVSMAINSDTTAANYDNQELYGGYWGSTPGASQSAASRRIGTIGSANATANVFGGFTALLPDYASTSIRKHYISIGGVPAQISNLLSGSWENTAAIATITLTLEQGDDFVAGTILELEGIGDLGGWSGTFNGVDNPGKVNGIDKADIESLIGVDSA